MAPAPSAAARPNTRHVPASARERSTLAAHASHNAAWPMEKDCVEIVAAQARHVTPRRSAAAGRPVSTRSN